LDLKDAVKAELFAGAQYASSQENGAHTGDASMSMIAGIGARTVMCGHSEHRREHKETDADVAEQAIAALEAKLHPLICIGETAEERDAKKTKVVLTKQLKALPLESEIVIAYEPIWAIGTGKTPTPAEAEEIHAFIRSHLPKDRQDATRILYGGSVTAANAEGFLAEPDIDGALVGGASIKPDEFGKIVKIALESEKVKA
jgi:triosephosphate isomerase